MTKERPHSPEHYEAMALLLGRIYSRRRHILYKKRDNYDETVPRRLHPDTLEEIPLGAEFEDYLVEWTDPNIGEDGTPMKPKDME